MKEFNGQKDANGDLVNYGGSPPFCTGFNGTDPRGGGGCTWNNKTILISSPQSGQKGYLPKRQNGYIYLKYLGA